MLALCMNALPADPPRLRAIQGGAASAPPTDAQLLAGIRRGDQRVATQLYRLLLPAVEGSLLRVLGRREQDHEDLVQTSFEQIVKTLSTSRFAGACSLKTWASSIAAHVALKSLRSRVRRRRVFGGPLGPELVDERRSQAPDAEQDLVARRELDRVRGELSRLSPNKAETLLLHDVLGHGLAEIAAMTGVTVAAAQTRLSRGRRELFRRLDREGDAAHPASQRGSS